MARFFTTTLVLLLANFVFASNTFKKTPFTHSGHICGITGSIGYYGHFGSDNFDASADGTALGCATVCYEQGDCLSFYHKEDKYCELHSGSTVQTLFEADDSSLYQGYDLSCFFGTSNTTTGTTNTAGSSSLMAISSLTSTEPPTTSIQPATTTSFSTSTIYGTSVQTITQGSSTYTTTVIIDISTTICPVTATESPTLTSPISYSTSTVYSSSVQTITSQGATYTTTVIIPVSTTICPITATAIPTLSALSSGSAVISAVSIKSSKSVIPTTLVAVASNTAPTKASGVSESTITSVGTATTPVITSVPLPLVSSTVGLNGSGTGKGGSVSQTINASGVPFETAVSSAPTVTPSPDSIVTSGGFVVGRSWLGGVGLLIAGLMLM